MFKRVTIIGLGLIGGSLGLAIKEKRLAKEIIGVSRRQSTIRKAASIGAVDSSTLNLKQGVKGSDLIILAMPVLKVIEIGKKISPYLKKGAIVIDVGSTKRDIVKKLESIFPDGINFVGSHPLAGSEKSGVIYANKDLFKGAYCILTRTKNTNLVALGKIKEFWKKLDMKAIVMNPEEHDRVLSKLSHLPHAAAVSLLNSTGKINLNLAAGGFKDTTRIASGEPELWKDIFFTNKDNLIKDIRILKKELSKIEAALGNNDRPSLLAILNKAKRIRDCL